MTDARPSDPLISPQDYRVLNASFRAHLQSCESKGWEHFDDIVFKIAAGGLAISVTFLGVARGINPASMPWMFGAWTCWSISLLALMLSTRTAQTGLRSQIARWDAGTYYTTDHPEGRIGHLTPRLNDVATVGCALGLVSLVVFALINLSGGMNMANNDGATRSIREGQQAPQAPWAQKGQVAAQAPHWDQRGQVAPQAPAPQAPAPNVSPAAPIVSVPAGGTTPPGAGQVAPQAPPAGSPQTGGDGPKR